MTAHIPMIDLPAMHAPLQADMLAAVAEVMGSGEYVGGRFVERFEHELAEHCGTSAAIGVSSGTDALVATLMALGAGPGDEIIAPAFTFFATAGAIARVGATPVFADIDPATFNVDPESVARQVSERTVGVVPVSLYGQAADVDAIGEVAGAHSLWVLEDASQSIGARSQGRMSGSMSTAGALSFYPTKNLGCLGDGGAVLTNDERLARTLRLMRNHGLEADGRYRMVGGNFRLDALQAALLSIKLPHLSEWESTRRANAARYTQAFSSLPDVVCPEAADGNHHVFNQYVLRIERGGRDAFKRRLDDAGVATAVYYPYCLHELECFAGLGYRRGDFPVAERAADEVLALPIWTDRAEEVIERVLAVAR